MGDKGREGPKISKKGWRHLWIAHQYTVCFSMNKSKMFKDLLYLPIGNMYVDNSLKYSFLFIDNNLNFWFSFSRFCSKASKCWWVNWLILLTLLPNWGNRRILFEFSIFNFSVSALVFLVCSIFSFVILLQKNIILYVNWILLTRNVGTYFKYLIFCLINLIFSDNNLALDTVWIFWLISQAYCWRLRLTFSKCILFSVK